MNVNPFFESKFTNLKQIAKCVPQDNMDCWYNNRWRSLYKQSNINNFDMVQNKIDDSFLTFVLDGSISTNKIMNNIIAYRDSFFSRSNGYDWLKLCVDKINLIKDIKSLSINVKQFYDMGISILMNMYVFSHIKSPSIYVLYITEPDPCLDVTTLSDEKREYIIDFISSKLNYKIESNFFHNVNKIANSINKLSLDWIDVSDPFKIYNSILYADFKVKYDTNKYWTYALDNLIDDYDYVMYTNSDYFKWFDKIISSKKYLIMIKDYMIYCILVHYSKFFNKDDPIYTIFNDDVQSDKKLLITSLYNSFGSYFDEIYHKENYNKTKAAKVNQLYDDIKAYCKEIFTKSNFFTKTTNIEALKKINTLELILGQQDYKFNLEKMTQLGTDFYINDAIINIFNAKNRYQLLNKPVNNRYFSINDCTYSHIVNAYYDPLINSIYIPTCIMDDIFIKTDESLVELYGGIGAIIAHEIVHCFDDSGSLFNWQGYLHNWWSISDYNKYRSELEKIDKQYDDIFINDNRLDSKYTLSENIADIGAMKLSFRTYLTKYKNITDVRQLQKLNVAEIDELKQFFKKWVYIIRETYTVDTIFDQMSSDTHSPALVRSNAPFSHLLEYYYIYDLKPTDFNWLDPEDRSKFLDMSKKN